METRAMKMKKDDGLEARSRWVLKKRRRMYRNLLGILDAELARRAADEVRSRRRPRRGPAAPDLNLLEEFKRTIMPTVAELAELAGVDKRPFLELAKPLGSRRRKWAGADLT